MSVPKPGDRYRDLDGRTFTLVDRVDPFGVDVKPYWRVRTTSDMKLGRWSTVREDRLTTAYTPVTDDESAS